MRHLAMPEGKSGLSGKPRHKRIYGRIPLKSDLIPVF
jgi:hypothetical protein